VPDDRLIITDGASDTGPIREYEATRRDLVLRGVVFGGLTVGAASVPTLLTAGRALAATDGDARVLKGAIGLEQTIAFAYATAFTSGRLAPDVAAGTRHFHRQEKEHARALIGALAELGGAPPAPPARVDQIKGLAEAMAGGQKAILEFAVALEEMIVAAYHRAAQTLKDAKLLQTSASIMCSEGQHLVVLREALRRNPVPHALETGEPG
jgi:ferritin-like protein